MPFSLEQLQKFFNSPEFSKGYIEPIVEIYPHAVIDMILSQEFKCTLIEINPFGKMSQSAYYSWVIDKELLYYPRDKVDLRLERP